MVLEVWVAVHPLDLTLFLQVDSVAPQGALILSQAVQVGSVVSEDLPLALTLFPAVVLEVPQAASARSVVPHQDLTLSPQAALVAWEAPRPAQIP